MDAGTRAADAAAKALVRAEGLEPPRLSSLEPKSSASTSSATPAWAQSHVPDDGATRRKVAAL